MGCVAVPRKAPSSVIPLVRARRQESPDRFLTVILIREFPNKDHFVFGIK